MMTQYWTTAIVFENGQCSSRSPKLKKLENVKSDFSLTYAVL